MGFTGTVRMTRRAVMRTGLVGGTLAAVGGRQLDTRATAAATPPPSNPFRLGIASGDPLPNGVVLWTRLAVNPLADNGLGGMSASMQSVQWQVATDSAFRSVVRSGTVSAWAKDAHSVHVEVSGLLPGRVYFYRF